MKRIKRSKRYLSFIIICTLLCSIISPMASLDAQAATEGIRLNNPIIVADDTMSAGQKVTYDCIWFGSYPQTEIVCEDSTVRIEALDNANLNGYQIEYDLVPASKFTLIENAKYDSNGEAVVDGVKYLRVKSNDYIGDFYENNRYPWVDTKQYHYFRFDKIKWRVLKNDGNEIFVLADKVLDGHHYGNYSLWYKDTWKSTSMREYLNGYNGYTNNNFIDKAFSVNEQRVILEKWVENLTPSGCISSGSNTLDKIFLLSYYDVLGKNNESKKYGFVNMEDEAKKVIGTSYAQAMLGTGSASSRQWVLRTLHNGSTAVGGTLYVKSVNQGKVTNCSNNSNNGIRPAMYLDLSGSALFTYAGTVCSDGTVKEVNGHINTSVANGSSLITGGSSGSEGSSGTGSTSSINTNVGTVSEVGIPETESTISKIGNAVGQYMSLVLVNTTLGEGKIMGPTLSVKDGKYECTPLNFDFKLNLPFNNIKNQIIVDENEKTVKVLLGVTQKDSANIVRTSDMTSASWSKQYNELKQLYKDISNGGSMSSNAWNRFQKLKGGLNSLGCNMFIKANMTIAGYMEFDYHTGNLQFREGGLIEEVNAGLTLGFPVCGSFITTNLGLEVGEKGSLSIVATDKTIKPAFSLSAYLKATGSIAGALPLDFLKLEGGVNATLTGKLASSEPKVSVDMSGDIFIKFTCLKNWEIYSQSWAFLDCQVYPEFIDKKAVKTATYNSQSPAEMLNEAVAIKRTYNGASKGESNINLENGEFINSSVFEYTSARMVNLNDGRKIMVYLDDLGTKTDNNRTSLMYSIFDGESWSEPIELFSDNFYYGEFILSEVDENGNVYLVFERGNQEFTDDMEVSEIAKNIDICMVTFDGNEFSDLLTIYSNSSYKILQSIVNNTDNVGISWVEFSEEYLNGTSKETKVMNAVYYKEEEMTNSFSEETIDVRCLESTTNHVYSIVTDARLVEVITENDVVINSGGVIEEVVNSVSTYSENFVFTVEFNEIQNMYLINKICADGTITTVDTLSGNTKLYINDGILYYVKDGDLCSYDGTTITSVLSTSVANFEDFVVVSDETQTYVVLKISDGFKSELYKTWNLKDTEELHKIEKITDYEKYIRTFDAILNENGNIEAVINYCDISIENEDANYENSQLIVNECNNVVNDISVDYLYFDSNEVNRMEILPLSFQITNNSQSVLNEFQVELTDDEGNVLIQDAYACEMAIGESKEFSLDYLMAEGIRSHNVTLEISVDIEESDYTNNKASIIIGNADIYVSNVELNANITGERVLKTTITNNGFENAENVYVYLYQNTLEGEKLVLKKDIGMIDSESIQCIELQFNDDNLERMKNDILSLSVKLETSSEEMNLGNNSYDICYNKDELNFPITELESMIDEIELLLTTEQYTTETLTPLLEKLTMAKKITVLSDGGDIISSYKDLLNAKNNLLVATAKVVLSCNPTNSGVLSGGGNYKVGDEVTITSKVVKGYTFDGWYIIKNGLEEKYTEDVTFKITITEDYDLDENSINLIAKYIPNESSYLSVIVGKGIVEYAVNGDMENGEWDNDIINEPFRKGTEIKLAAKDMIGYDFLYWVNVDTGKIVSETKEYVITMSDSLKIQACYISSSSLKHYVVFRDINNVVLWSGNVVDGNSVNEPEHGNFAGHEFVGWDTDFSIVTSDMIIGAIYEKISGYNLMVSGGTVVDYKDEYSYGDSVTVIANESQNGKYFSGWYENDTLVSNSRTYSFYITGNKMLEARYDGDEVAGEQAIISMVMGQRDTLDSGKQTVKMDVVWSIPDGYSLLNAGIIMTLSEDCKNLLVLENVNGSNIRKCVSALISDKGTYSYTLTLGLASVSKNLHAVGYYQYQNDETGEIITDYTVVSSSMAS